MKRRIRILSTLAIVGSLFIAVKEVNQVEDDIDYVNDHSLNTRSVTAGADLKDAVRAEPTAQKARAKHRVVDPEKIYEDADYLVKIRIFKRITIPLTNQVIYKETGGFGSGTIVKCRKYKYCVLTAFHVVDNSSMTFFSEPKDGSQAQMLELISGTTTYDSALLKFVDPTHVPKKTAKLGRSSAMKAGAPIHAMGSNRYGDFWFSAGGHLYTSEKQGNPVLKSILSGAGMIQSNLLLFNTPIFHGYSGGPLHNKYGEVIGVTIGYTTLDEEPIYIGSPIDEVRKVQKLLR